MASGPVFIEFNNSTVFIDAAEIVAVEEIGIQVSRVHLRAGCSFEVHDEPGEVLALIHQAYTGDPGAYITLVSPSAN